MLLKGHFPRYGECPFSVVMVKSKIRKVRHQCTFILDNARIFHFTKCPRNWLALSRYWLRQVKSLANIYKAIRRIIRECNDYQLVKGGKNPVLLPELSCRSLRHTFTTRLV